MPETMFAWQDTSLAPRERAEKLVGAMTLEQKIVQLHDAMETIDIYAITREAAESGVDMDQLAAQIPRSIPPPIPVIMGHRLTEQRNAIGCSALRAVTCILTAFSQR